MAAAAGSEASKVGRTAATSRVRFFYRDAYVYDVLEAGPRHTFDVERPRRIRDALVATGLVAAELVERSFTLHSFTVGRQLGG